MKKYIELKSWCCLFYCWFFFPLSFTFNSNLDNDGHTYIVLITIYNKQCENCQNNIKIQVRYYKQIFSIDLCFTNYTRQKCENLNNVTIIRCQTFIYFYTQFLFIFSTKYLWVKRKSILKNSQKINFKIQFSLDFKCVPRLPATCVKWWSIVPM